MAEHNELGQWGETKAAEYLIQHGYTISQRDWHSGRRDLDIVALTPDSATLVIVEVKTRKYSELEAPEEAVNKKKIRNIAYATNDYIKTFEIESNVRFDIISIIGTNDSNIKIEHIIDAFNPLLL